MLKFSNDSNRLYRSWEKTFCHFRPKSQNPFISYTCAYRNAFQFSTRFYFFSLNGTWRWIAAEILLFLVQMRGHLVLCFPMWLSTCPLLTMQGGTAEAEYAATDFAPPGDISSVTRSCGDIKKFISDTLCDKGPSENSTNFHRVWNLKLFGPV